MVAARAEENEKREKGKDAAEKADKRIKMDEETDRALEKWTGVALPRGAKGGDALREMEEGILNAGLENEPGGAPRGEAAAVENGGNTSTRNPFLDALTSGNSIFQDGGQGKSAKSRRGVFAPVSTGPGSGGSGNPAMLNLEQFSGFTPDTKSGRNPFLAALEFPLSRPPVSSASAPIQQNPLLSGSGISALPGESGTVDLPNPRKNSSKELPDCSLCGKPFYIAHLWHLCYYFPVREPNGWAWERVSTRTRK